MKVYAVHVPAWKQDSHCGSFKTLIEAHDAARGVIRDRTRNVQIFVEWEYQLPLWLVTVQDSQVDQLADRGILNG